jgi:predicted RNase H-like nuclease (RuvC/YqgF family)
MKKETSLERYVRRQEKEIPPLQKALSDKEKEIDDELEKSQNDGHRHIDNGAMFEGSCTRCGKLLG